MPVDQTIRFGDFRLHPREGLTNGTKEIRVTPKSLSVLCALAERAGLIISKDELFHAVWPHATVSDSTLTSCIQELRKALGDDARAPRYIETLHRRGFRFIAPIAQDAAPCERTSPSPTEIAASGPIVGRAATFKRVLDALELADAGTRQVLFLTGEPGIGKTALVHLLREQTASRGGYMITHAECVERYGAGEAYQPLLEA